ncbi:MAG: class I SAM-dependent methyltransferase [Xenococcaceae cyanobacterium MO_188.B29]|nr:class I SAM-dependent methyltransferase [Xenococcaceae cyanobacterium MO_188.B29]
MADRKNFIPALGYDWLTGFYDLTIRLTLPEREIRTRLIDELALDSERILEFGFGTGQNLLLARQKSDRCQLVGVDIDPKVKAIAADKLRKVGLEIQLDLYDGKTFPYKTNSFDKVYSCLVFHQLDRETKSNCLREIFRVLKPNGKLVIGDWGKAKNQLMRVAFYTVQLLDGFETTTDNVKGLLPDFITVAGFREVKEVDHINTILGSFCYYRAVK